MADVSPQPVQDWGSLMSSFGNSQANQNLTNAQTQQVGVQTQTAQMQNQIMRMRMPLIQKALQDFTLDQNGGGSSNQSGEAGAPGSEEPSSEKAPAQWYDPARVDAGLRQRYYVNPAGTPQDMRNIVSAGLSGDPGLLEAAKQQRELSVSSRLSQSQNDANKLYESMTSVTDAPDGRALDALEALSPDAAKRIRSMIPDEVTEDAAARQYASHIASTVHQYSGREVVADTGGTYRDKVTGKPMPGVEGTSLNPEQWTNLANHEAELVDMKNSDGSVSQVPRWKATGAHSLQEGILRAAVHAGVPEASPTLSGSPKARVAAAVDTAAKAASKNPPKQPTPPGAVPAPPSPPDAAPGTPAPGVPSLLPGIDLAKLPKPPASDVVSGHSPSTEQAAMQKGSADERVKVMKEAAAEKETAEQGNALLTQFQNKLQKVNPRDVGPGSSIYKGFMDLKTAISGKAPSDLVDMGVLDKFANQLGVQNIRSLLAGQRITNQEMMTFLTRASASTTQPLDVMKTIVAWQKANNDFDRLAGPTKIRAMQAPYTADPFQTPGIIEAKRNDYVARAMEQALGKSHTVVAHGTEKGTNRPVVKFSDGTTAYGN